jgi:hypothetical protein
MLDHELRQACLLETLPILRNGQRLVADLSAQHLADGRGNSGLIQLSRSAEGIGLPDMSGRLCQDGRDNPRLVLRGDWSMAPVAIWQIDDAIFDNSRRSNGSDSHSEKNVGRRWTPNQSKRRSAIQWSRAE